MSANKAWQTAGRVGMVMVLLMACLGAVLPSVSSAQDPTPWRGEYFNNESLTGEPLHVREESEINYDWEHRAPFGDMKQDYFSVRWTALLLFEEDTYLFKAYTDDGVRLWVDGVLLIDQWRNQVATLIEQPVSLSAGYHSLRMEYYDNIGDAVAILWWEHYAGPSGPAAPGPTDWRAEYFNNQGLSGPPVLVCSETAVNHDWRDKAPADGVWFNSFSARWTADKEFDAGTYVFKAYTDDGVRLWLDGQLIIDQWHDHYATLYEKQAAVSAGLHSLTMEYYDHIGDAVAVLWWERVGGPVVTTLWRAEYFGNPWLIGPTAVIRDETDINYDWGDGAPVPQVGADDFSVRWTGTIRFAETASYTFFAEADDGVRVWVDGGLLIDQWAEQSGNTVSAVRQVTLGDHPIIVEYYDHSGTASIKFWWEKEAGPAPSPSPGPGEPATIIVDDLSAGFQKAGPSESWYERSVGYDGHTYWTYNSNSQVYNFAKWVPELPHAGDYEVYAHIPKQRADTKKAHYRISHNGQYDSYWVDQSIYFDQWVSLGTYDFTADGTEYVYLDDVTGEAYASHKIAFDAIKFVTEQAAAPTATPTPGGPTATPTAATTPGTPTPTPTCSITPIMGFGHVWTTYETVRDRLGCPVEPEKSTWSAEQTFIGGYMFWREDLLLIYAVYSDGTWQSFADTWDSTQIEEDPTIVPPSGYYQPKRGFGKVWREQPGVRDKLSWATAPERGFAASWQAFDGGLMLWSDHQGFFVLYNDGTWSHY